jgi:hypothetical protein
MIVGSNWIWFLEQESTSKKSAMGRIYQIHRSVQRVRPVQTDSTSEIVAG